VRAGRWNGYGQRPVEQSAADINQLRRDGYVGKPLSNWWVARNDLYKVGFQPKDWKNLAYCTRKAYALTEDGFKSPRRSCQWPYDALHR
jgi:hypothetical protein